MMKTSFYIPLLALALTACSNDELTNEILPEGKYPLIMNATGLQTAPATATRASVDGNWDDIQTVAVQVGDAVKEYTVTTTDAEQKYATLSSDTDPHWWTSRDDITVNAWWPYAATMQEVVVKEDQSTQEAFESSDYIAAINQTVEFNNPTLAFEHRTARVTVNLQASTGISNVDNAKVSIVNLSTDSGNPPSITAYHATGDTYEVLTAPQMVEAGNAFIQIVLDNGTFTFTPENNVVLEANHQYTYNVTVTATKLELTGCSITAWDEYNYDGTASMR